MHVAFYSASCCETKQNKNIWRSPKLFYTWQQRITNVFPGGKLLMAPSWCKGQRRALVGVRAIVIKLWPSTFRRGEPWGMQNNFKMPNFSRTNDFLKNVWSWSGISSENRFSKREERRRDFCLASACFFISARALRAIPVPRTPLQGQEYPPPVPGGRLTWIRVVYQFSKTLPWVKQHITAGILVSLPPANWGRTGIEPYYTATSCVQLSCKGHVALLGCLISSCCFMLVSKIPEPITAARLKTFPSSRKIILLLLRHPSQWAWCWLVVTLCRSCMNKFYIYPKKKNSTCLYCSKTCITLATCCQNVPNVAQKCPQIPVLINLPCF